jgi:integrase
LARKRAKIRQDATWHDLRHYYASLLIRHGESVKTVQARLGHASAVETLDTCAHLWPDSEDPTRQAVEDERARRPAVRHALSKDMPQGYSSLSVPPGTKNDAKY